MTAGPAQITSDAEQLFLAGFVKHDGYFLGGFGQRGHREAITNPRPGRPPRSAGRPASIVERTLRRASGSPS